MIECLLQELSLFDLHRYQESFFVLLKLFYILFLITIIET